MKFVHAANIGFGYADPKDEQLNINRREEYLKDLRKLVQVCHEQAADVLFLTGGLFHGTPNEEDLKLLDACFSELSNVRVFLLPGRRDGASQPGKVYEYKWNSNVTVFGGDCIQRIYMADLDLEVTGTGYAGNTWEKVRNAKITPGRRGKLQVLLLPELLTGEDKKPDLPSGFDYVGCGNELLHMGNEKEPWFSPGLFEPNHFSDQILHGFLSGELLRIGKRKRELTLSFLPAAYREYVVIQINANEEVPYHEICAHVEEAIKDHGQKNFYELVLCGQASPSLMLHQEELYGVGNVLRIDDRTEKADDLKVMKELHSGDAVGEFLRENTEIPEEAGKPAEQTPEEKLKKKALQYGIEALLKTQEE